MLTQPLSVNYTEDMMSKAVAVERRIQQFLQLCAWACKPHVLSKNNKMEEAGGAGERVGK